MRIVGLPVETRGPRGFRRPSPAVAGEADGTGREEGEGGWLGGGFVADVHHTELPTINDARWERIGADAIAETYVKVLVSPPSVRMR